ncbi:MAG TPA: EAL domain-containing protein [Methylophilaceae bacterium]|nr:EAL domain-containing protein [Methylophilaceae bacterium]
MIKRIAEHWLYISLSRLFTRLHAHFWLPWAVLAFSLGVTYEMWQNAQRSAAEELKTNFDFRVREASNRVEDRIMDYKQVLRGIESLYAASFNVERDEFHSYTNTLRLLQTHPSLKGLGYAPLISDNVKGHYILNLRKDEFFSRYTVRPEGKRDFYAPITYVEPYAGHNMDELGFDLYTSRLLRDAMERARDSGAVSVSSKLQFDDGTSRPGFFMFLPVYANGLPHDTPSARHSNLTGWLFAMFTTDELVAEVLGNSPDELDFEIYDGGEAKPEALMYDRYTPGSGVEPANPRYRAVRHLTIADHDWTLVAKSLPAFEARLGKYRTMGVVYTGVTASILLALLFGLLIGRTRSLRIIEQMNEELIESEERWKYALEGSGDGIWDWDAKTRQMLFSKNWATMLGFEEHEIGMGMEEWKSRIHPEDLPRVLADIQAHLEGKTPAYVNEHRCLCKDGTWKWILDRGMVVSRDADVKPLRMVGTHTDITERKQAEESMQLASLVYRNSSEGMMVTDLDGVILNINPAFTAITGYSLDEVAGKNHTFLNSGRQDENFYRLMWQSIHTEGRWQGEVWNMRKDGEVYVEWLTINTIYNEDGTPHRLVSLFSDITKKKATEELVWKQANFDSLTGLPNRRMFLDRLDQEIKKSHRARQPLAVMLLDLDHFKEINDTLGHDIGDLLLQEAAKRLTSCVRETDTVARLGGDEFTVILGSLKDPSDVERVYQEILRKLAEPFQLGNEVAYVSVSIGITLYPEDSTNIDELLKNADQAMYEAKSEGRNRYSYFTPSMQEAAQNRMRMVNDLHGALQDNQFRLLYQPIIELATGEIHKAEALIRWQHPTRGLINPAEFIPVAEDTGMIIDIGDWVFRQAAQQVKRWREIHHRRFQISVNKSPVQFLNEGRSHNDWIAYLHHLGLPGNSIVVEITERLLLDARTIVMEKLMEFHDAGMQVSLDDFGTGYSSLSYLKKFHIDYLKIDQSFVFNLAKNSIDMALCEAIIHMSHKLGMRVIAEGVETEEQRDLLAGAGCDYVQGYLFSPPVSVDEFERMLKG